MKKEIIKSKQLIGLLSLVILTYLPVFSQLEINLYDGEIPNAITNGIEDRSIDAPYGKLYFQVANPSIELYFPSSEKNTGTAVIICPGGGYAALSYSHEGTNVAKRFAEDGITAIVLKYRLPDPLLYQNKEIVPLQDAQRAFVIVRENAANWNINPNKIGIMGSSAGGHLASTVGTHIEICYAPNPNHISVRPDFMILNYPVISFADSITHNGSRLRLIGDEPIPDKLLQLMGSNPFEAELQMSQIPISKEKILEFSNELHVTPNTPPAFIIHANDDKTVPIQNSILFIAALQQAGVDADYFFYATGGHGFGIDNSDYDIDWVDSCIEWIKEF